MLQKKEKDIFVPQYEKDFDHVLKCNKENLIHAYR